MAKKIIIFCETNTGNPKRVACLPNRTRGSLHLTYSWIKHAVNYVYGTLNTQQSNCSSFASCQLTENIVPNPKLRSFVFNRRKNSEKV